MNFKNIIIYVLVVFIIIASLKIPEILFEVENKNLEKKVFKKEKIESKIQAEAENIYLVKALRDISSDDTIVAIGSNEKIGKYVLVESENNLPNNVYDIYKEILKLKDFGIIKDFSLENNENSTISMINRYYENKSNKYEITGFEIDSKGKKYEFVTENKTGKLIIFCCPKEDVNIDNSNSLETLLRNYIKYLDLYIIDDWKFENGLLKSEKAGLVSGIANSDEYYSILFIRGFDENSKNVEYIYK